MVGLARVPRPLLEVSSGELRCELLASASMWLERARNRAGNWRGVQPQAAQQSKS
jgi:hypothetical protein